MLSDEENALRCASRYIAMKLLKHYKTGKGTKARQFVDCLSNMAVVGDDQSFYAYTKDLKQIEVDCLKSTIPVFFSFAQLNYELNCAYHNS